MTNQLPERIWAWVEGVYSEALSEARKVHAEEASAIRAPQETSE